jgi:hypothetical protein
MVIAAYEAELQSIILGKKLPLPKEADANCKQLLTVSTHRIAPAGSVLEAEEVPVVYVPMFIIALPIPNIRTSPTAKLAIDEVAIPNKKEDAFEAPAVLGKTTAMPSSVPFQPSGPEFPITIATGVPAGIAAVDSSFFTTP